MKRRFTVTGFDLHGRVQEETEVGSLPRAMSFCLDRLESMPWRESYKIIPQGTFAQVNVLRDDEGSVWFLITR